MDPFELERFVEAQAGVYAQVLKELRAGEKRTHWMWFVFPQLQGLGQSEMARRYGLSGREEAIAYLDHGVLGPRLRACTQIVAETEGKAAEEIFGYPDDLKFCSSMTLFHAIARPNENGVFERAIQRVLDGKQDDLTLIRLRSAA